MVMDKTKSACKNSKVGVSDHIVDVNNMVKIRSSSERKIELTTQQTHLLTRVLQKVSCRSAIRSMHAASAE